MEIYSDRLYSTSFRPRASRSAQAILAEIGLPERKPFVPDPFQREAVKLVQEADVLVSAPTGSGKTWIAEQSMRHIFCQGGRCWYASPLKALSNSKYREFGEIFGQEKVGILTGDRKENAEAPIIVGTTEILRNQLYDAMASGESLKVDLVVLDEAHYLADPERGVVWEEVIIYLPARVRLLLLSATLANAEELAAWMAHLRRQACRVVRAEERPVPLAALFLAPDGEVQPLTKNGQLTPRLRHLLRRPESLKRAVPVDRVLLALEELDLLPAIFFLPSRADCDQALAYCRKPPGGRWAEGLDKLEVRLGQILAEHPFLRGDQLVAIIRRYAVASHHAGHLPHLKLVIERLMQEGLLRAIFSTSTVAAGVNFPARSVVLPQSDRFNGQHFVALTATELKQMTGRAGRRGMDKVGFIVLPPGPHQNLRLLADLLAAPPEPIQSQMQISFSMVLNLILSHAPDQVRPLLDLSLAAFQSAGQAAGKRPDHLDRLGETLRSGRCGRLEEAIFQRRRQIKLETELAELEGGFEYFLAELRLASLIVPGRVVLDDRGRPWLVVRPAERADRPGVVAARISPRPKMSHGRLRLKFLPQKRIGQVTKTMVEIGPDRLLASQIRRLASTKLASMAEPEDLSAEARSRLEAAERRWAEIKKALAESPCQDCPLQKDCLCSEKSALSRRLGQASAWLARLAEEKERLWFSFLARLNFLKAEGFADPEGRLTKEGLWASQLRLEHPLLIAEAIRRQALPESDPALLAGLIAPFVLDRERAWSPLPEGAKLDGALLAAFRRLEQAVKPLAARQEEAGFEAPRLRFVPAWAMFNWASGRHWEELIGYFQVEPGDMAALVFRTADNLRQLAGLEKTHPRLAETASAARGLILREPVEAPV